jgi:hypothetical protein
MTTENTPSITHAEPFDRYDKLAEALPGLAEATALAAARAEECVAVAERARGRVRGHDPELVADKKRLVDAVRALATAADVHAREARSQAQSGQQAAQVRSDPGRRAIDVQIAWALVNSSMIAAQRCRDLAASLSGHQFAESSATQ